MKSLVMACMLIWAFCIPVYAGSAVVDKVMTTEKVVAFSVEDVENVADLDNILGICQTQGLHVTFFSPGQFLEANAVLGKKALAQGHEFGYYGVKHQYWGELRGEDIKKELNAVGTIMQKTIGTTAMLVRPPYNYYENEFIQTVADHLPALTIVRGIDTGDWMLTTSPAIVEQVVSSVSGGEIINLNMQAKIVVNAFPEIIRELKNKGYKIVTVSELLAKAPVQTGRKLLPRKFAVIRHIDVDQPLVALTFDDSGSSYQVNRILDILKKNNVRSTFFLQGDWVYKQPDVVRKMIADGHEVANHSYSHPRFTWLSSEEMQSQITADQAAVEEVTGTPIAKYFRPPYGEYNNMLVEVTKNLGYQAVVLWDVDTRDWSGVSATDIVSTVLNQVTAGSIVLFHLHGSNTGDALNELIPALRSQGYRMVTVTEMFQ